MGVLQGSGLGPILFTIYIHSLGEDVSGFLFKFANDTKLVNSIASRHNNEMQFDLDRLQMWADEMRLSFNASKSGTVHFGYNNVHNSIKIGNNKLNELKVERD